LHRDLVEQVLQVELIEGDTSDRTLLDNLVLLSKSMILLCLRHAARTRRNAPGTESKSLRDEVFDFHTPIHQHQIYKEYSVSVKLSG
jgi:hypothetical protein